MVKCSTITGASNIICFLDLIPLHALQVCFVRARGPHSSEAGCRMMGEAKYTHYLSIMSRHDKYPIGLHKSLKLLKIIKSHLHNVNGTWTIVALPILINWLHLIHMIGNTIKSIDFGRIYIIICIHTINVSFYGGTCLLVHFFC